MANFREIAAKTLSLSDLMAGREKMTTGAEENKCSELLLTGSRRRGIISP